MSQSVSKVCPRLLAFCCESRKSFSAPQFLVAIDHSFLRRQLNLWDRSFCIGKTHCLGSSGCVVIKVAKPLLSSRRTFATLWVILQRSGCLWWTTSLFYSRFFVDAVGISWSHEDLRCLSVLADKIGLHCLVDSSLLLVMLQLSVHDQVWSHQDLKSLCHSHLKFSPGRVWSQ